MRIVDNLYYVDGDNDVRWRDRSWPSPRKCEPFPRAVSQRRNKVLFIIRVMRALRIKKIKERTVLL
jgi:hypothetical protein